jgi:hypothetical protein
MVLPPLKHSYLKTMHPNLGGLSYEPDREGKIMPLTKAMEGYMEEEVEEVGYKGDKNADGIRHGKGVDTWANGSRYEGDWVQGKQHGKGVLTYCSGIRYEGDFVQDKRHGKGVLTYADGGRYEGDYVQNKQHGKGVYTFANGNRYEGMYVDGKMRGTFEVRYMDGRVEHKEY